MPEYKHPLFSRSRRDASTLKISWRYEVIQGAEGKKTAIFPHSEFVDFIKNNTSHGWICMKCGTLIQQKMLYHMTLRSSQSCIAFNVKVKVKIF